MKAIVGAVCLGVFTLSFSLNVVLLTGGPARADRMQTVGVVDVSKANAAIKRSGESQAVLGKVQELRQTFQSNTEYLTKVRYLSDKDRAELSNLKTSPTPAPADRSRIEELEAVSSRLDQEFQELAMVERPSKKQRQRLSELQSLRESRLAALKAEERRYAQLLSEMEVRLLDSEQKQLQDAAAEVARERQLDLVVDRQLVLFGGKDVTAELLARLAPK